MIFQFLTCVSNTNGNSDNQHKFLYGFAYIQPFASRLSHNFGDLSKSTILLYKQVHFTEALFDYQETTMKRSMTKRRARKPSNASFLFCPHCQDPFQRGRSYSGHVRLCPFAQRLPLPRTNHPPNPATAPNPSADSEYAINEDSDIESQAPIEVSEQLDNEANPSSSSSDDELPFQYAQDEYETDEASVISTPFEDHATNSTSLEVIPISNGPPLPDLSPAFPNSTTLHHSVNQFIPHMECYTSDDIAHLQLLRLCKELRAPQYSFDAILAWAQNAKANGYTFPPDAPSRKTFMDNLYKRFNMSNIKPKETEVPLFPNKTATVVTFSFVDMAKSLLSDSSLMVPSNLINPSSVSDEQYLSDIHTGSWFKAATLLLCINGNDVLCPIILFIDKTQVDTLGKWTLEPVLFTLGIFNQATRNLSQAWRPLGLVTNTVRMSSATYAKMSKKVSTNSHPLSHYVHNKSLSLLLFRETTYKTTIRFCQSFLQI